MESPNWLEPAEQTAWRGFLQVYAELTAVLGRELMQDSGLSIQDYGVLVALSEAPDGKMRAFELGRELVWEKSRLSHHITRMITRDLVTRQRCPTDQRGAYIAITPQGRKAIDGAAVGHVAAVRRYFIDRLTPGELGTLTTIAAKTRQALGEAALNEVSC